MTSRHRVLAITALALVGACGMGQLCDPDQTHANGVCYGPDAAPALIDADPAFAHFGDVCTTDMDCAIPTGMCAKQPSDPTGYCTRIGCLAEPAICPSGWSCFDLSVLQAGLPSMCSKP